MTYKIKMPTKREGVGYLTLLDNGQTKIVKRFKLEKSAKSSSGGESDQPQKVTGDSTSPPTKSAGAL